MNFPVIILGLLAFTPGLLGQTTNVQACIWQSNANTLPINAYINGCTNPPCTVPQLENIEINLVFKAPRRIQNLRTEAHAYMSALPIGINYPLGDEAYTCNFFTNTYCPLLQDEVVQYKLQMFIESWMPAGTSVNIEFVIRDVDENSVLTCLRTGINIVPPTGKHLSKESKNNNVTTYPETINKILN